MTVAAVVQFVEDNDGFNKVFIDWTKAELALACDEAIANNSFGWSADEQGMLTGIVVGIPDHEQKVMHIVGILTTERKVFRNLILLFVDKYPGWNLTGRRNGKIVNFKTNKLLKLTQVA
jgi:hypothetical protein